MLKAALYARVSSEEQAKRENSIPAQLRALREYCRKNNIEIFKEYKDEGITVNVLRFSRCFPLPFPEKSM